MADQFSSFHGKRRGSLFRVSAHGLVDHHAMDILFCESPVSQGPLAIHSSFQSTVDQPDAVLPFDHGPFRMGRLEDCILDRNSRCGIDGRRAAAFGNISPSVHLDHASAPVGPDGRR